MTKYEVCLTDSLEKVLPGAMPRALRWREWVCWPGETVSFQVAARILETEPYQQSRLRLVLEGSAARMIRIRRVQLEPVLFATQLESDENYLTKTAAMLPDALVPLEPDAVPIFRCLAGQWDTFWCDWQVAPDMKPGIYELDVLAKDDRDQVAFRQALKLHVQQMPLPKLKIWHTEWFHADCLADYYQVPVWSDAHWQIVENYIASAAAHNVNMLLTPLFTPPLDTAVGKERTTCQLLNVRLEQDTWQFDFSRLDRWIELCKKHGIQTIELNHLFTQWGAAAAPKVVATIDGQEKRIFGWDTPAVGGAYTRFLRCLLPELKDHLRQIGMLEHTWFHISDEPDGKSRKQWKAARRSVADLLEGCHVLDAMSDLSFFLEGEIQTPVAANDHIEPFVQEGVPELWTYYCCCQCNRVPNRFTAMPSARNRILGALLYRYELKGFLHWGFNFYHSACSERHIDPWKTGDGDGSWPAGDPFLVYPGPDGVPYESIRGAVLREAFQDHRLLCLAEAYLGRAAVLQLLERSWGGGQMTMEHYPTDPEWFWDLRNQICCLLAEHKI